MTDPGTPGSSPSLGKASREAFDRTILPRLGAVRPEVLVGPAHGVDAGVVDVGGGQVMVATTDPLYVLPALGWERAAWFALHIVASDACTTGLTPQYAMVDCNLPPDMSDAAFAAFWDAFHGACAAAGIAIVTGHTGRYEGCRFPTIGGLALTGFGSRARLVTPSMAGPGDVVLVTKGAAIETVGHFGVLCGERLREAVGEERAREAEALFDAMSVVADARAAAACGVGAAGVTAMHDATEFGLLGALWEIAQASGNGIEADGDAVRLPPAVEAVCDCFGIDPFAASSEGTLVLTVGAAHATRVLSGLHDAGIPAWAVGELRPADHGLWIRRRGVRKPLAYPDADPFWPALMQALAEAGRSPWEPPGAG